MKKTILLQALSKVIIGFLLLCALIFVPAGTLHYVKGWVLLGILFLPIVIVGIILIIKNPELLKKRLNMNETQKEQLTIIVLSTIQFISAFILAGFDYRYGWSNIPNWLWIISIITFILAYSIYVEVLRENKYLSRTVEIQENQKVVDTGLYAIVRHPMYFSTIILFWSMPLILGSWISFIVMLPYPLFLIKRIKNEEYILQNGLEGYIEYMKKVKYRLLPFIW